MLGLIRAGLDQPPAQAATRAVVREKEPDRAGADDQDISIECGIPIVRPSSTGGQGTIVKGTST